MRIGAIIQARYDSTRLEGKVLKKLPFDSDETILSQIHSRLEKSLGLNEIIIATSDHISDDIIYDYSKEKSYICARGSKENVLQRFVEVINERKLDVVVRITGDNPIVLVDILDSAIEKHVLSNADYTRNNNLPYGTSFEIINAGILRDIHSRKTITQDDQEHVTTYIKNHRSEFQIQEIDHDLDLIDFRFTVDYPSDYAAMNIVFQHLREVNYEYDYHTLKRFVEENEWASEINKRNIQKRVYSNLEEEISEAIRVLEGFAFKNAVNILKRIRE